MNRILMTHLYFGDPRGEFSGKLAETLLDAGADILEVGIPYADPVCDGEVFQRACKRALENGITPIKVLEGIRKIRDKGYKQKIYLTSYYGPIFKIGIEKFVQNAKKAGVDGLIVPDILLEEQKELQLACRRYGLSVIQFATVYSTRERLKEIIKSSTDLPAQAGFIYCVSIPGVTGDGADNKKLVKLVKLIKSVKSITKKPIYVGFGIKSPIDVKNILQMGADGVIVGSAIARIYEENIADSFKSLPKISTFIKTLKESTISL